MAEDLRYTDPKTYTPSDDDEEINLLEILGILRRRWIWFGTIFGVVLGSVIIGTSLQTPIFQSQGRLLLKSDNTASGLLGLAEQFGSLDSASSSSNPVETEIQVLLSPPLLNQVIQKLQLKNADGLPLDLEKFKQKITASEVRGTDVIELSYQDSDAQLAASIIDTLMDIYVKNNVEINRSQSIAARQFISEQLPRSENQLKLAQLRLKEFKQRNNLVEPTEEANAAIEGMTELQSNIIATRAELQEAQTREAGLRAKLGGISSEKAIASGGISGSSRLQSNINALDIAQDDLSIAEEALTDNHPDLQSQREKVAQMEQSLSGRLSQSSKTANTLDPRDLKQSVNSGITEDLVRIENESEGLQQRLSALERSYNQETSKTLKFPGLEEQFTSLALEVEVATLAYTNLYESLQKSLIAENQNIGNVRILHQASLPKDPISPRLLLNILMGGILGLVMGAGAALLVDARDLRMRTLEDVRRIYNYTLLGAIPDFSKLLDSGETRADNLFVRDRPRSMISETYRMINTNLKFSRSDNLQVIVISSGMPGEGKSSTLANIALAMAELGNKVILIDADMRLPSQHQIWELPNRTGLSHVLVENSKTISRLPVIPESENLDILLSGTLPPNPTTLLDSKRCHELIDRLRAEYDYVLIDVPPITVASDALLISKMADGLILVARPGKLNRAAANVAANLIRQAQVNVLGVIGNGISPKDETNSTQYYQQEYYGQENLTEEPPVPKGKSKLLSLASKNGKH